ncbi:TetR family transcriptional regulator [Streptomyces abyssalis]|uniref:TetR family transcriptional regulator n=1 Tax=Streptomyces abyssalis TaxID=933944 RepID=A0A1E7JNJ9_9ACTN|nr:TetR/AcrR family transcriptional regulator [Streptomyces abyssalis]OEU86777.1 TetR family transcriptional regulator [Streptomyces abyssalis]OEU89836.1 TetR family transcriptional regulator [Streptomyces abyssalis]OEV07844.1 TetR family transcriptional regulator [Streptomyces nanshensis]
MSTAERTRERILAAACEVIAEVGFEKIRMRMVAEHAGVSTALLHYHFENREKLFAEAMTHSFAHTSTELERDAGSVPAAVILARILRNLLPTDPELRQDWRLWQELWVRALRDETAQGLAVDLYDQLHSWVGEALRRGIGSGEFADCDIDTTSTTLLALCDGFGIRLMLGDPRVTVGTAQTAIWAAAARELKITPEFPRL